MTLIWIICVIFQIKFPFNLKTPTALDCIYDSSIHWLCTLGENACEPNPFTLHQVALSHRGLFIDGPLKCCSDFNWSPPELCRLRRVQGKLEGWRNLRAIRHKCVNKSLTWTDYCGWSSLKEHWSPWLSLHQEPSECTDAAKTLKRRAGLSATGEGFLSPASINGPLPSSVSGFLLARVLLHCPRLINP